MLQTVHDTSSDENRLHTFHQSVIRFHPLTVTRSILLDNCEFTLSLTFFTKSKREEVGNRFDSELDYNLDEESLPTSALVGLKFHNLQLSAYMHSCRDDGILLLHDQSENLFH